MAGEVVSGVDAILRRLDSLQKKGKVVVVRAAISGGLTVVVKQIKKDTDPQVKEARKGVRSRFKKGKSKVEALAGFGVGKRRKKKITKPVNSKGNRKGGLGIGASNIHWWVAGTKKRTTGAKKGKPTGKAFSNRGRMPAMQPGLAREAYQKSKGKIQAEMIRRGALALQKETAKLQAIR